MLLPHLWFEKFSGLYLILPIRNGWSTNYPISSALSSNLVRELPNLSSLATATGRAVDRFACRFSSDSPDSCLFSARNPLSSSVLKDY
jgi:hypothetical protein